MSEPDSPPPEGPSGMAASGAGGGNDGAEREISARGSAVRGFVIAAREDLSVLRGVIEVPGLGA